jgi:thiamine biosynthesis lipoprotein
LLVAGGCKQPESELREKLYVFGTIVEITIRDSDKATAQAALKDVGSEFRHMHKDWHAWKPGELSSLNAAIAAGKSAQVSDFLLPLLLQAQRYERTSDGLFNAAIGGLVADWGFHDDNLPKGRAPPYEAIRAWVASRPNVADLVIKDHLVSSRNKDVSLDFGGFAKGEALDRAVIRLKAHGIRNAVLNAGGDLNVMGVHSDRPWRAGIRHPKNWGVIATVELKPGEVLYTSGNYERFLEHEGVRYSHIIDPRTGWPVKHIVSASVIGTNGAAADAAATALSVAGPEDWFRIAKRMGVRYAMLVDDHGRIYLNPAMKARIHLKDEENSVVTLSPRLF